MSLFLEDSACLDVFGDKIRLRNEGFGHSAKISVECETVERSNNRKRKSPGRLLFLLREGQSAKTVDMAIEWNWEGHAGRPARG
jgi:hypothetical protein